MIKLFSEIIGSKVVLAHERAYVGFIQDVIISDKDGSFLGVSTSDQLSKDLKYIPAVEFKNFGANSVLVFSYESLSNLDDLVRMKEPVDKKIKIIGSIVFTSSGEKVGKVNDASLNLKTSLLDKIFVTPRLGIKFLASDLVISAKNIEQILPKKIIVSDGFLKKKSTSPILSPMTAVD